MRDGKSMFGEGVFSSEEKALQAFIDRQSVALGLADKHPSRTIEIVDRGNKRTGYFWLTDLSHVIQMPVKS